MIIDAYTHILPKKYQEGLERKVAGRDPRLSTVRYAKIVSSLLDLDARFKIMDAFGEYVQVISVASPPIYDIAPPDVAKELCAIANDELAELVFKYPDRFAAGIACLPMNDVDAAVAEAERAVKDLRLKAVEFHSHVAGKPLDAPEFLPLYEKMVELDRPIFLHPMREATTPDYPGEEMSKYRVWTSIGWPYATGLAMTRLVYGGVMEKFPDLRIVTHHCGGIIPFVIGRLDWSYDFNEMRMGYRDVYLKQKPIQYFKRFYYDTAVNGNSSALMCGLALAGIDHMLFATDDPFDSQNGLRLIRDTIASVEAMGLSEEDKKKVYEGNATSLLRLPFCALSI
ncbi:MAG: amidohydrolase 2 [Deltaproteobacteria bacterium]|jgi:aminocarboxymuconate-semialdehyde decarboxylase|nr:amidohydrolase 2 [Deltaproteobacteria bacterium]